MGTLIENLEGRELLDSRGNPTVGAFLKVSGREILALVPSGASTGKYEALELRDNDDRRFLGRGVLGAVNNIGEIFQYVRGIDIFDQKAIDQAMIDLDGTINKSRLGANAILAVSLAVARASAEIKGIPLYERLAEISGSGGSYRMPVPLMNLLNGGVHAGWQGTDFREFMIVPHGASSFEEGLRWGVEVYHHLGKILKRMGQPTQIGDEGGFVPRLRSNEEAIGLLLSAIDEAKYKPGEQISIALDPAASELFDNGVYTLRTEGKNLSSDEMVDFWDEWSRKYPIVSIEDGLSQDDWYGWKALTKRLGGRIQIVGDDLLATNSHRIEVAIKEKAANVLLAKLNQIGTLTETILAVKLCDKNNWRTIISHRSGETEDTFIADFAVALGTGQIKTGAPARSDRVAKYNRLLKIERDLRSKGVTLPYSFS